MSSFPIQFGRRALVLSVLLVTVVATTAAHRSSTVGATGEATSSRAEALRHTRLLRSIPGKDSVIASSPATIQLWFSEKIELGLSRVRIEGAGKTVALSPLTQNASVADAPVVGRVPAPLADGTYTVHWTAASGDGHSVKGSFGFTIKAR
jgi:hypothetical protein